MADYVFDEMNGILVNTQSGDCFMAIPSSELLERSAMQTETDREESFDDTIKKYKFDTDDKHDVIISYSTVKAIIGTISDMDEQYHSKLVLTDAEGNDAVLEFVNGLSVLDKDNGDLYIRFMTPDTAYNKSDMKTMQVPEDNIDDFWQVILQCFKAMNTCKNERVERSLAAFLDGEPDTAEGYISLYDMVDDILA